MHWTRGRTIPVWTQNGGLEKVAVINWIGVVFTPLVITYVATESTVLCAFICTVGWGYDAHTRVDSTVPNTGLTYLPLWEHVTNNLYGIKFMKQLALYVISSTPSLKIYIVHMKPLFIGVWTYFHHFMYIYLMFKLVCGSTKRRNPTKQHVWREIRLRLRILSTTSQSVVYTA